jgi:hypothetical protein
MKINDIIDLPDTEQPERQYLIFSDAQFDFIYENQAIIDVEFTEEEKNFRFI